MRDAYPPELVESVEALARLVLVEEDVDSTSRRIVRLAVHAIDGAEDASISLAQNGEITTVASTSDVGQKIDSIQYATGEGPCLSSIAQHATFHIRAMETDETWPTFSKRASAETRTRSMVAVVLELQDGARAALNLSSSEEDAFGEEDVTMSAVFAAQAGVALANALTHAANVKKVAELEEGMGTRQMIGQAVGIIMATRQVDDEEAFDILKKISQTANIKLRDIAKRLVDDTSNR